MQVEMSVSDARAKRRVLAVLQELGHRAASGSVRLAYPFSVVVEVRESERAEVVRLVASIDPGAGTIVSTPAAPVLPAAPTMPAVAPASDLAAIRS